MKKKIIIGSSFIIFFFSLLIYFYFKSSNERKLIEKKKKIELIKTESVENDEEKIRSLNIIEDVSYSAKDAKGNEYFVEAREGTIDQKYNNFIFLKSVNATIRLKNYELIEISSDFGKYNTDNFDTIFTKNVIIFTPIIFKIFEPHFNLGLSFLFSSSKFLKKDIPSALAAIKKIIKNSSIAPLFNFDGQLIDFSFLGLLTKISAIGSPLYIFLLNSKIFTPIFFNISMIPILVELTFTFLIII